MTKMPLRFALIFSLLSTTAACLAGAPGAAPGLWPGEGCAVGDVHHTEREKWVYARGFGRSGDPAVQEYRLVDDTGPASALHVAMTASALGSLAKVEVQDAEGNWEQVWSGEGDHAAPAACTDVWFERSLADAPREVKAIRLGFAREKMPMQMAVGRAGLRVAE